METAQIITSISARVDIAINFLAPKTDNVNKKLQTLENEWDLERVYEMNADVAQLSGSLLGRIIYRQLNSLPVLATTFLAQQTTPYWNPPISIFKLLGYRMKSEIERERITLVKVLNNAYSDFNYIKVAVA